MNKRLASLLLIALTPLASSATSADFATVQQWYQTGDYQKSFTRLQTLAKRGYGPAQVLLSEAYGQGHGSKIDYVNAYAWALMAKAQNQTKADALYLQYRTLLTSRRAGKQRFGELQSQYGQQALSQNLYPQIHATAMPISQLPQPIDTPEVAYPTEAYEKQQAFWSIVQFDINESGHVENLQTLASYPNASWQSDILTTINTTLSSWQFKPQNDAANLPKRFDLNTRLFALYQQNTTFIGSPEQKALMNKANAGDAKSQYVLSKLIEHDVLSSQYGQSLSWLLKAAINGYPAAQFALYQCLSTKSRCEPDKQKAAHWLTLAEHNGYPAAKLAKLRLTLANPNGDTKAAVNELKGLVEANQLPAIILYAKTLTTSEDANIKDLDQAIKLARQAMAIDHNNPQLLGILAVAHFELGQIEQAQNFLLEAVREAEYRRWPIDYYVNLLEKYQRAVLLPAK